MTEEKKPVTPPVQEGEIAECTVEQIMPYGAFVDIGGEDGLVHVSDLSHGHIDKPEDVEAALKEAFSPALKERLVFMDFQTDQTENVWPMVQGGKGLTEMILGSADL